MLLTTRDKIDHYIEREKKNLEGGGAKQVEKQHENKKYLARERIDLLFDAGTFVEMDLFAEHRCTDFGMQTKKLPFDGVVTGYG